MAYKRRQITAIIAVGILQTVDVQFMYPMQQPVYMMPPPPPMPVPVPFPVAVPYRVITKPTTTTTTKKPEESEGGIAIPIAIPMPVPYAVPAAPPPVFCVGKPRAPGCPPCPPCSCKPVCTPAFFSYCSPCHQVCRCRNGAPMPLPPVYPPPVFPPPQPAVVIVPFPPPLPRFPPEERDCDRRIRIGRSSTEDESSTSTETDYGYSESSSSRDSTWFRNGQGKGGRVQKKSHKKRRGRPQFMKKRRNRSRNHRQFLSEPESSNGGDSNLVKPVLAYVSENGKVVFHRNINDEDAARLMGKDMRYGGEQVNLRQLNNGKSGRRMVETKEITGQNKKVIFKTPANKKVSNLSVSFSLV